MGSRTPRPPPPALAAAPALALAAAPNGVPLIWQDPWGAVAAGGHQYATSADHDYSQWTYREILVDPATNLDHLPAAGTLALEALRIAAWRPRLSTEVDEKSIPHELDWLRSAVHLNKGCYRGQETVAKVHNLGHPPRRLVMLHLDGSDGVLPEVGAEVLRDDDVIGRVTSVGLHYELGPIALAVIKTIGRPCSHPHRCRRGADRGRARDDRADRCGCRSERAAPAAPRCCDPRPVIERSRARRCLTPPCAAWVAASQFVRW